MCSAEILGSANSSTGSGGGVVGVNGTLATAAGCPSSASCSFGGVGLNCVESWRVGEGAVAVGATATASPALGDDTWSPTRSDATSI